MYTEANFPIYSVCNEVITLAFHQSQAVLYWRLPKDWPYFKDIESEMSKRYKEDEKDGIVENYGEKYKWPCREIPVEKMQIRSLSSYQRFKSFLARMADGATFIRDLDEEAVCSSNKQRTFSWKEAQKYKEEAMITNSVVTYLMSLAYKNCFCV